MIKLLLVLVGLYGLGFAGVTLWFLKVKGETLEVSVKKGANWWKFALEKIKEKLNSTKE